jgi:phospholipase C
VANQLGAIKHIGQLMLENRSFDQMLGCLYEGSGNKSPHGDDFDGLTGNETNPYDTGREWPVFKIKATDKHPYFMPGADPGEGFYNTNYQLFETDNPQKGARPTNRGFLMNFNAAISTDNSRHWKDTLPGTQPQDIMGMYTPELLPVISGLATGFAVCDRWFASVPTQTIPNRAFAAAGTSLGHLKNTIKFFTRPSIIGRLDDKHFDWAIYGYNREPPTRHDFPDTDTADETHFGHFRDFQARAAAGTLPEYTFLEPNFSASGNSQHHNYDVALGEQLSHDVYYALRDGRGWDDTLLLITYDEHGGNYDHVAPPANAVPPDDSLGQYGFDFKQFGVRIPALLISPRIKAGTVFRARRGTIDHTSVLKTIQLRWGTRPLTARVDNAPSLGDVLTLQEPRTDDPLELVTIPVSNSVNPNLSKPSTIEKLHALRVSELAMRNDHGTYDQHSPPDLSTSQAIGEYIQDHTAAWKDHLERFRHRHQARGGTGGKNAGPKKAANRPSATTAKASRGRAKRQK